MNAFCNHNKYQLSEVYALLTANKTEKNKLGIDLQGDMLIRDVPQQAVNFSSHKIHAPCASSTELNTALRKYLFDRVVALVKKEMTTQKINQTLKPADDSYESRVNSLDNPDVYLNTMIEYIETPNKLLSIDKIHFKLSKLGIKLDSDDGQCANEFDIHEIAWSDGTKNVAVQIVHKL